ncbi:MAG: hypothetical protein ACTSUI_02055 [Promethearchaeota archaeon]
MSQLGVVFIGTCTNASSKCQLRPRIYMKLLPVIVSLYKETHSSVLNFS